MHIWGFHHDSPSGGSAGEAGVHPSPTVPHWYASHYLHCHWPLREPGQLLLHRHCDRWVSPAWWRTTMTTILINWGPNEKSCEETGQRSPSWQWQKKNTKHENNNENEQIERKNYDRESGNCVLDKQLLPFHKPGKDKLRPGAHVQDIKLSNAAHLI